jgi:Bestrophin, RFP-TM, chloride channel
MAHVALDMHSAALPTRGGTSSTDDPTPNPDDDNDYSSYTPEAHPDLPELPEPSHLLVGALQFFAKSDSIPYRTVCAALVWSAFIVSMSYVESRVHHQARLTNCYWWCSRISIDSNATTYAGFPLFLLLGFRVNQAYARYMEAASIWNEELKQNALQFLTQVGLAFRRELFHENDRERIFALVAAFVETLKRTLRGERELGEVRYMLSKKDADDILAAADMPDYCISLLNAYVLQAAAKPAAQVPVPGPWYPMVIGIIQSLARSKGWSFFSIALHPRPRPFPSFCSFL